MNAADRMRFLEARAARRAWLARNGLPALALLIAAAFWVFAALTTRDRVVLVDQPTPAAARAAAVP